MTKAEIIASLKEQAIDKDYQADGDEDSIFADDAQALREAAEMLEKSEAVKHGRRTEDMMPTDHKRTYSQRGDDYLLEAWKVCEKEKPAPRCPLCGEEMHLGYAFTSNIEGHKRKWHYYCKCGLWLPLMDTPEEALSTAQKRWQEPNRMLTLEEVREHCKQGADAAPLWVEFHKVPSVSRWMVVYKPEGVFAIDMVQYYLTSFDDGYNRVWRCWLRKPTQEERATMPWREK